MPSSATASRIPAPRRPIAAARSIPRPVNSLSVARKYTPTVQRARPSTTIATMASALAAMSISKPVNPAIASPSAPKPASSLPCIAAPCRKLAAERTQARRQRVIANLQAQKKRHTAPRSSRAVPPATITPVSILKPLKRRWRVIPPPPANSAPSTVVSSWTESTSLQPRGKKPYCGSRPCALDRNGNHLRGDYRPHDFFGIGCTCHPAGGIVPTQYWIRPREWETTPAEADVDPSRRRIVRFADNPVRSTRTISPWWNTVWPPCEASQDHTTEAEDDAAIHAIDNPPRATSNFHSTWQALMDQGFPDDDEYY